MELLSEAWVEQNPDADIEHRIVFGEQNTLGALIEGFDVLARVLKDERDRQGDDENYGLRVDTPTFLRHTTLKQFSLMHTIPHLDLVADAKQRIESLLADLSQALRSSEIAAARNELLHFQRSSADVNRLVRALDSVFQCLTRAEAEGIIRTVFLRTNIRKDE